MLKKIHRRQSAGFGFAQFHPAVPFFYFCGCIGLTMCVREPAFLLLSFCCASAYLIWLRGVRQYRCRLPGCFLLIVLFTALNTLNGGLGLTVLFYLGGVPVTLEVLVYGACSGMMAVTVLLWFSCMQEALPAERLVQLFGRIMPTTVMMVSMVFRYIPDLIRRGEQIWLAGKAMRGCPEETGRLRQMRESTRQGIRTASVLLGWTMENSLEMTASMQSRGYGSGKRGRYRHQRFGAADGIMLTVLTLLLLGSICVSITIFGQFRFYPFLIWGQGEWKGLLCCGLLFLFPLFWEGMEAIRCR